MPIQRTVIASVNDMLVPNAAAPGQPMPFSAANNVIDNLGTVNLALFNPSSAVPDSAFVIVCQGFSTRAPITFNMTGVAMPAGVTMTQVLTQSFTAFTGGTPSTLHFTTTVFATNKSIPAGTGWGANFRVISPSSAETVAAGTNNENAGYFRIVGFYATGVDASTPVDPAYIQSGSMNNAAWQENHAIIGQTHSPADRMLGVTTQRWLGENNFKFMDKHASNASGNAAHIQGGSYTETAPNGAYLVPANYNGWCFKNGVIESTADSPILFTDWYAAANFIGGISQFVLRASEVTTSLIGVGNTSNTSSTPAAATVPIVVDYGATNLSKSGVSKDARIQVEIFSSSADSVPTPPDASSISFSGQPTMTFTRLLAQPRSNAAGTAHIYHTIWLSSPATQNYTSGTISVTMPAAAKVIHNVGAVMVANTHPTEPVRQTKNAAADSSSISFTFDLNTVERTQNRMYGSINSTASSGPTPNNGIWSDLLGATDTTLAPGMVTTLNVAGVGYNISRKYQSKSVTSSFSISAVTGLQAIGVVEYRSQPLGTSIIDMGTELLLEVDGLTFRDTRGPITFQSLAAETATVIEGVPTTTTVSTPMTMARAGSASSYGAGDFPQINLTNNNAAVSLDSMFILEVWTRASTVAAPALEDGVTITGGGVTWIKVNTVSAPSRNTGEGKAQRLTVFYSSKAPANYAINALPTISVRQESIYGGLMRVSLLSISGTRTSNPLTISKMGWGINDLNATQVVDAIPDPGPPPSGSAVRFHSFWGQNTNSSHAVLSSGASYTQLISSAAMQTEAVTGESFTTYNMTGYRTAPPYGSTTYNLYTDDDLPSNFIYYGGWLVPSHIPEQRQLDENVNVTEDSSEQDLIKRTASYQILPGETVTEVTGPLDTVDNMATLPGDVSGFTDVAVRTNATPTIVGTQWASTSAPYSASAQITATTNFVGSAGYAGQPLLLVVVRGSMNGSVGYTTDANVAGISAPELAALGVTWTRAGISQYADPPSYFGSVELSVFISTPLPETATGTYPVSFSYAASEVGSSGDPNYYRNGLNISLSRVQGANTYNGGIGVSLATQGAQVNITSPSVINMANFSVPAANNPITSRMFLFTAMSYPTAVFLQGSIPGWSSVYTNNSYAGIPEYYYIQQGNTGYSFGLDQTIWTATPAAAAAANPLAAGVQMYVQQGGYYVAVAYLALEIYGIGGSTNVATQTETVPIADAMRAGVSKSLPGGDTASLLDMLTPEMVYTDLASLVEAPLAITPSRVLVQGDVTFQQLGTKNFSSNGTTASIGATVPLTGSLPANAVIQVNVLAYNTVSGTPVVHDGLTTTFTQGAVAKVASTASSFGGGLGVVAAFYMKVPNPIYTTGNELTVRLSNYNQATVAVYWVKNVDSVTPISGARASTSSTSFNANSFGLNFPTNTTGVGADTPVAADSSVVITGTATPLVWISVGSGWDRIVTDVNYTPLQMQMFQSNTYQTSMSNINTATGGVPMSFGYVALSYNTVPPPPEEPIVFSENFSAGPPGIIVPSGDTVSLADVMGLTVAGWSPMTASPQDQPVSIYEAMAIRRELTVPYEGPINFADADLILTTPAGNQFQMRFIGNENVGVADLFRIGSDLLIVDAIRLSESMTPPTGTLYGGHLNEYSRMDETFRIYDASRGASTTDEWWSLNDVSLHQQAWNITTLGGSRFGVPALRGEDIQMSNRPGRIWVPKTPDSRVITLIMWMAAIDPATGLPPTYDQATQWNDNWNYLRRLFYSPKKQHVLTRRWRLNRLNPRIEKASAKVQLGGTMDPRMTGRTRAEFAVDLVLADPYFYGETFFETVDVTLTSNLVQPNLRSIFNPGDDTAGFTNMTVTFFGPLVNPRLVNLSGANGNIWMKLNTDRIGSIAAGDSVSFNIEVYKAVRASDGKVVTASVSHSGAIPWFALEPGQNACVLEADAGTGHASIQYRAAYV